MAAAEYFSNAPVHQSSPSPYQPTPTSHPQALSSPSFNPSRPSVQAQPPPPYQEQRPGVHFAPTPLELHQRHSFSGQQRPPQNSWNPPPQQGYGNPYAQQNAALQPYQQHQQHHGTSPLNGNGTPPHRPQYLSPHMLPYANPNSSQFSLENAGYSSDPEPHRRKHKNRHRRDSGEARSTKSSTRSTNADAFVGAAGGGLIGDLIFPGLGTIGGAAIGWFGGKDYGNHRKGREDKRHKEQRKWEEKHGTQDRSRSRDYDNRDSSTYLGERHRRHSGY